MFNELEFDEIESNENAHQINESFREREIFERKIRKMGIDIEEKLDDAVLRDLLMKNEL